MEVKYNDLKDKLFKCSENGCDYVATLSFNKAKIVW